LSEKINNPHRTKPWTCHTKWYTGTWQMSYLQSSTGLCAAQGAAVCDMYVHTLFKWLAFASKFMCVLNEQSWQLEITLWKSKQKASIRAMNEVSTCTVQEDK